MQSKAPKFAAVALALSLSASSPSAAERLNATPQTLTAVLKKAKGGDTVILDPGIYRAVRISERTFVPALTLDARSATVEGLAAKGISGLTIEGGTFTLPPPTKHPRTGKPWFGFALRLDNVKAIKVVNVNFRGPGAGEGPDAPYGQGYGLFVVTGSDFEVSNSRFKGFKSGIVLTRVRGFHLNANHFDAMRSDGIQIAESRNGRVEDNVCGTTRIRDKEHPDCIQLWSRPTSLPTADVTIRRNRAEGPTQGIGMFNHIRNGVDDGGFDRILIEDNDMYVGFPHGIALIDARDSIVRNNRIRTYPGARWRAGITVGPANVRCGNTVASGAGKPAINDAPCKD